MNYPFPPQGALGPMPTPALAAPHAVAYVGPGDLATALYFWGVRAYKNSTIGVGNVVRIVNETSLGASSFGTVAGGGLDLGGINGFLSGAQGQFAQFFEQVSGVANFNGPGINSPNAGNPKFTANGALSSATFLASASRDLALASGITAAQPFTIAAVVRHIAGGGDENVCSFGSGNIQIVAEHNPTGPYWYLWGGTGPAYSGFTTDGHFHSIICIFNDPSNSLCYNDGVSGAAASAGTANLSSSTGTMGVADYSPTQYFDGDICELCIWHGAPGGAAPSVAAIFANQQAFYGSLPV